MIHVFDRIFEPCWRMFRAARLHRDGAAAVVLVVGIGTGLLSAVFCLTDRYLFAPLPFPRAQELIHISVDSTGIQPNTHIPRVQDWQARRELFQQLASYEGGRVIRLRGQLGGAFLSVGYVSPEYLAVLGLDDEPLRVAAASNSHDVSVILTPTGARNLAPVGITQPGQVLLGADGTTVRILRILPPSFLFPDRETPPDGLVVREAQLVATPISPNGPRLSGRLGPKFIARLQPGTSVAQVASALNSSDSGGAGIVVKAVSLSDRLTQELRPLAVGTLLAALLVTLLCLGNVGNLFGFRRSRRASEIAIRRALGAGRIDLFKLWIVEVLGLGIASSFVAVVLALMVLSFAKTWIPEKYSSLGVPDFSGRAIVASLVVSTLVIALASFAQFVRLSSLANMLAHGRSISGSPAVRRLRAVFTGAQAAIATMIAIGSFLLLQSYFNLIRQDDGFADNVVSVGVNYPVDTSPHVLQETVGTTVDRLRRLPGVRNAAATTGSMVNRTFSNRGVIVAGRQVGTGWSDVTPEFFAATGIKLAAGRILDERDEKLQGVVVNQTLAKKLWPNLPAVGQVVTIGRNQANVVGVVQDVFDKRLDVQPEGTIYALPNWELVFPIVSYVMGFNSDGSIPEELIRREIVAGNAEAVTSRIQLLEDRLLGTVQDRVFAAFLVTLFAVVSTIIAITGLIAVVSFAVRQRTRELAIRTALGALPRQNQWLVSKDVVMTTAAAGFVGLVVGQGLSRSLATLVYGVEAGDWPSSLVAMLSVMTVMIVTALVVARRLASQPPGVALRID